jgi:SET domain-containing protein
MVFVASRDIREGEECCISYFDLTRFADLKDRRDHLQTSFRFICRCSRCLAEEPPEEDMGWDAFPAFDED